MKLMHDDAVSETYVQKWAASFSSGTVTETLHFYTKDALLEDIALNRFCRGHEEIGAYLQLFYDAVPDMRISARKCLLGPAHAAVHWTWTGTVQGSVPELPDVAPGTEFSIDGGAILEFAEDGRIARETDYWDTANLLRQFGLLPG
ncbi:nuclear transport factor 2 family protein [Streptomyces beigongshangae]|uniref:nuclear transport factor 2 family protein n=1 Tax=Streptomyces beigongshangae TaxID=2841597 RepID=UPI001C852666|nr:nuclear transport factor 2 family protein [Streptomyces sp. REN17]